MPRVTATIDSTLISATLTNFPVCVVIDASHQFMASLGSTDWQNIHATVGGVECYVEVDVWDTSNDDAVLWVRVPSVSAVTDTVIQVATGSTNTSYVGQTGSTPAKAVWDSNYVAVYHMSQDPSTGGSCVLDSTSNALHATPYGSMTTGDLVDGPFGKSLDFDGTDDYLNLSTSSALRPSYLTISGAYYHRGAPVGTNTTLLNNTQAGGYGALYINSSGQAYGFGYANNGFRFTDQTIYPSTNVWNYFACSYDGSNFKLIINDSGVLNSSYSPAAVLQYAYANATCIGAEATTGSTPEAPYFNGLIAEIHISNVSRSDTWISATTALLSGYLVTVAGIERGLSDEIGINDQFLAHIDGQGRLTDAIGFDDSFIAKKYRYAGFSDQISFAETFFGGRRYLTYWSDDIGFDDKTITPQRIVCFTNEIGIADVIGAVNVTDWLSANYDRAVYRFYASMSGGSGLYALPGMTTLQYRMRNDEPSYLTITLPYSAAALEAIAARTDGQIIIEMAAYVGGVESLREELLRCDYYSVRYDRGATNQSITLVGYATRAYANNRIELRDVSMITMLADGRMQYRCAWPDFYLRPGDTAVHGSMEITVGSIMCIVSPVAHYMDVQESSI